MVQGGDGAPNGAPAGGGSGALPGPVLRQVSGVVLLHVLQASRYDAGLVPTWLDALDAAAAAGTAQVRPESLAGILCI